MSRLLRRAPIAASAIALLLSACSPVTRKGLEPLVTDRPDFTESTETVARGMRQLEAGTTFSRTFAERNGSVGEALLRIGVARRTELRVGLNSFSMARSGGATASGFEDISLGTKIKLLDGGPAGSLKPALSLIVASSLPTGANEFRARKPQPEMKFGAAWDITSRVAFSSNLNYARVSEAAADYGEFAATGSVGVTLTDRLGAYAEYFTFMPTAVNLSASRYVNGGFTYGLTDNLQLDLRSGFGAHRRADLDYFFGAGVSRRW